ncbi:hypothetical protein BKD30_10010 [Tersicoccus phoenicis]|uniref:Uncharacterized protein n=1 Tax=Tersicoccus phoenicis TaxID=554083 RepID=A0A1R1L8Y6_9MICC|nr:hypothetical protein BKD30_10010 [Tersicoccus phoenicis]
MMLVAVVVIHAVRDAATVPDGENAACAATTFVGNPPAHVMATVFPFRSASETGLPSASNVVTVADVRLVSFQPDPAATRSAFTP